MVDFIFGPNSAIYCVIEGKIAYTLKHKFSAESKTSIEKVDEAVAIDENAQSEDKLAIPVSKEYSSQRAELFTTDLYYVDENKVLVGVKVKACYQAIKDTKPV